MNNLTEKEQLIIKSLIADKIHELENKKSEVKSTFDYTVLEGQITTYRKILNKISK